MGDIILPSQDIASKFCAQRDNKKYISVSIHDVTPKFYNQLDEIISRLYDIGIDKMNLLLVPDWAPDSKLHENDYRNHPKFVEWLKALKAEGCEFAQHGCHHKSPKRKGHYSGPIQYVMGEFVAVGLAEFQNLGYWEAMKRIQRGQKIFSETGLEAKGFVPPWWQLSSQGELAMKYSKFFDYYMATNAWDLFGRFSTVPIVDLKSEEKYMSRELCFEPRDKFADYFTRGLAYLVTRCEQANTIRFGIHPPDVENKEVFDYIIDRIKEVKPGRKVKTYSELLAEK